MAKKEQSHEVQILKVQESRVSFCVFGTRPFICERPSEKAMRELLFPKNKSRAGQKQSLKHDPISEYRDSPYLSVDSSSEAHIQVLSASFKGSMREAALDVPGVAKTEVGRLCWVNGERLDLFGVPQMLMSVVRQSDMNHTPDIRTRAIVPNWACRLTVSYISPMNETSIANLLALAGRSIGVGGWRPQKGKGTYGQFELVNEDDPRFVQAIAIGGRKAQEEALANPQSHDDETERLYRWFEEEIKVRGKQDMLRGSNGAEVS